MPKKTVKIRGIYTTALTRLLLDHGYAIAQPSSQIQERFRLSERDMDTSMGTSMDTSIGTSMGMVGMDEDRDRGRNGDIIEDILIRDREDHQGVRISGSTEYVVGLISLFRNYFLDMVVRSGEFRQLIGERPKGGGGGEGWRMRWKMRRS